MTKTRPLLRERHEHQHARVTYVELFFDLVFVFAVTQLSHAVLAHPTVEGVLHAAMLLAAVWWAWVCTSWITNWLDPERVPVRLMMFLLMAAGLVLSAAIPNAFGKGGLTFACAYAFIQVGRSLFFLVSTWREPAHRANVARITAWVTLSAVFWIAGGLLDGEARIIAWIAAIGIDYLSALVGFWTPGLGRSSTSDWVVEGGHMAERTALFTIIALGESIIVTGATVVGMPWTLETIAAFATSLVGSIAMWWIYFSFTAEAASEAIAESEDPGAIARLAYTYSHLIPIAGIIVAAVGDEWVIHHPVGHADPKVAAAVIGGPALFLLGVLVFKLAVFKQWSRTRLAGLAALAALIPVAGHVSPLVLSILSTLTLVAVGAWETWLVSRSAR